MRPEDYMSRLAFIRHLYMVGIEQSHQPLPTGAKAVLTLHDAVEMFLQLAIEHLNAGAERRTDFDKYFVLADAVLAQSGNRLADKASMLRLNNARVGLKHYGTLPAPQFLEEIRSSVTDFFTDNTPLVFDGVRFETISLVNLVQNDEARSHLQEAETLLEQGDLSRALELSALAFDDLVWGFEHSKRVLHLRSSPFFLGRQFSPLTEMDLRKVDRSLGDFVREVRESIEDLRDAVRMLMLGLDYRTYARFKWLTPHVRRMVNGSVYYSRLPTSEISEEDVEFCIAFVVESAIRLQEADFEIESPFKVSSTPTPLQATETPQHVEPTPEQSAGLNEHQQ